MTFTTLSIRIDVAERLRAAKKTGESYSDTLDRLLENQPAKSVGEWLKSLEPLEGRSVLSAADRKQLRANQLMPRPSKRTRRATH